MSTSEGVGRGKQRELHVWELKGRRARSHWGHEWSVKLEGRVRRGKAQRWGWQADRGWDLGAVLSDRVLSEEECRIAEGF